MCAVCGGAGAIETPIRVWVQAADHAGFWAEDAEVTPCACLQEETAPGWTPEAADVTPSDQEPCPF
jgi:hypothetical protein